MFQIEGHSLTNEFNEIEIIIQQFNIGNDDVVIATQAAVTAVELSVAIVPPKFQIPAKCLENCPICFEEIVAVNMAITTCGHSFHCFCLLTAVERCEKCPLCRYTLLQLDDSDSDTNSTTDSNTDSNSRNSSSDSNEYIVVEDEDTESNVTIEQLAKKMTNMGYTMMDLLYMLTPINSTNPKHTDDFCEKIFETINKIKDGTISLSQRDTRSYLQVVGSAPAQISTEVRS